jgi:hypothetical protein
MQQATNGSNDQQQQLRLMAAAKHCTTPCCVVPNLARRVRRGRCLRCRQAAAEGAMSLIADEQAVYRINAKTPIIIEKAETLCTSIAVLQL